MSPAPLDCRLLSTVKARYEELQIINIRAIYSQQIFNSGEIGSMSSSEGLSQNYVIAVLTPQDQGMWEI
jgi:hypothetical protein